MELNIDINYIKDTRLKIKNKLQKVQKVKSEIKKNYTHYIKKEKQNYFGLDSFHFQNKLIDIEYSHLLEQYHLLDNRIYGDYYKLFIMISETLKKELLEEQLTKVKELTNIKNYPIYKDLDNYKKYDFDVINGIHQDLVTIISIVRDIVQENKIVIREYKKQLNYGINIDNYIISHEYMNNNLDMINNLYESYLNVYHKYHAKLLNNYLDKIKLFLEQINHNIVDDTNSNEGTPRQQKMAEYLEMDMDVETNGTHEDNVVFGKEKEQDLSSLVSRPKSNHENNGVKVNIEEDDNSISNHETNSTIESEYEIEQHQVSESEADLKNEIVCNQSDILDSSSVENQIIVGDEEIENFESIENNENKTEIDEQEVETNNHLDGFVEVNKKKRKNKKKRR